MPVMDRNETLTERRCRPTIGISDQPSPMLITRFVVRDEREQRWLGAINQLRLWLKEPGVIAEQGVEPPSSHSLTAAIELAKRLSENGLHAPTRIAPNGEGGVCIERRAATDFAVFEVSVGGTHVEFRRFRDRRLVDRIPFNSGG